MTLQQWMDKKGLTDAEVAERLGVLSRSQVNRIRRNKSRPKPEAAQALSRLTRIPAATFLLAEVAR